MSELLERIRGFRGSLGQTLKKDRGEKRNGENFENQFDLLKHTNPITQHNNVC